MSNGLSNLPYVKTEKSDGISGARKGFVGCLLIIVVASVGIAFAIKGMASDSGPSNNGQYEAIAQCEARVENLLKSPGTADFETNASGSGSSWTITGSVDSENGFGALVRSDFQCTVSLQGEGATTTVDYLR
jgi:hypothetical protein